MKNKDSTIVEPAKSIRKTQIIGGCLRVVLVIFFVIGLCLPKLILGQSSGALYSDGYLNREDYVDIGNNPVFRFGTGDFTLEAWIKSTNDFSVSIVDAIAWDWSKAYALEFIMGKIDIFTYDDSTGEEGMAISPTFNEYNDGNWHHAVGVRENNVLYLYVDGTLVDTGEEPNPIDVSHEYNLSFIYSPGNNVWFEGSIDEVRIYNRAISASEASEHYSGVYSNETGLVGLWHFDEMEGSTALDSSGYENHGTIYGATWVEGVTVGPDEGAPPPGGAGGIVNADPIVRLMTPTVGTYNKTLTINYTAFDRNIGIGDLKANPIKFFYSTDWGINWNEIAKDQFNTGSYNFDTTQVPDGTKYKIRVVALDGYNYFGDAISETFSIDNTGPTFDISISPFPVREKDTIELKIISSEELRALPKIQITQESGKPKTVTVSGSGREFTALYYVVRGYHGKTIISISGEDLIGNIGKIITSGKTFLVERFGPPPPTIEEPVNNQVFTESIIGITGTSQPDTEVALILNGISKFTTKPLSDGSFRIENISLSTANKGYNTLSIVAIDEKGIESLEVVLKVKLNSPPGILSTSISSGETFSGEKEITWTTTDLNDDKLIFSIEYSNDEKVTWDFIVSDYSTSSYTMDTTQLADGSNYFLKLTADDGTVKISEIFKNITIKNNLPHISLDIPPKYFTNINTPVFTGKVTGSEKNIASVEYSLDGGATWQMADAFDGKFDSIIEKIEIAFSEPLAEGRYAILIKAVDTLNRSVKISRSFNIDTIPPDSPVIELPLLDKIVDDSMDTNLELDGIQVVFQGEAELESRIELILENEIYETTANEREEFEIKDVTLWHGFNKFSLSSSDLANNISWIDGVVILNNLPQISILSPEEGKFLAGTTEIAWQAQDLDNDPMVFQILYQKKDKRWLTLAEDLTSNIYKWDISKIASGEYKIKIIVSDGISEAEEILNVFIDNVALQAVLNVFGPPLTATIRPTFSGQAFDDFSGIQYVEYSFNNVDWYKALITEGYQTLEVSFRFRHRFSLPDGDYEVMVRTTDRAGNIAYSEPLHFTIDTIPPRVGSNLISSGNLILFPDETGAIKLFEDTLYKILISVEKDAKEVSLSSGEIIFDLNFNKSTLLWENEFNLKDIGDYPLEISTRDEAGNSQTKEIALLRVLPLGQIYNKESNQLIKGAKVTLYVFDQRTNSWLIWDGQAFNQKNPQETNEMGDYGFLVPAGKYQLEVSRPGFEKTKSQEFEVENNYPIGVNIPLWETSGILNRVLDYFTGDNQ